MLKYDARCEDCDLVFEEQRSWDTPVRPCPDCGGRSHVIWRSINLLDKAKDPYDLLDGPIPSSKPIKSFAHDRRQGGKDTVGS